MEAPDDFKVVNRCDPPIVVVSRMPEPPSVIRITGELPKLPAVFTLPVQSSCSGGVCPTPQVQRRGLFR